MPILLFLTFVLVHLPNFANATPPGSSGHVRNFRLELETGVSKQSFSGVAGAQFDEITHFQYSVSLLYKAGWWSNGLRYNVIPDVKVTPFTFVNGTTGEYTMEFKRIEFLTGYASTNFAFHLIFGREEIGWSGTPQLTAKSTSFFHYGAEMSYDLQLFGAQNPVSFPIAFRYLQHPARKLEFNEYPNETVSAKAGSEMGLMVGVNLDF